MAFRVYINLQIHLRNLNAFLGQNHQIVGGKKKRNTNKAKQKISRREGWLSVCLFFLGL